MAHNITFINNKNSFAENISEGNTAWHGLGTKINGKMDIDQALKEGGQRFRVVKQPVIIFGKTTDFYATARIDTGNTFGIVKEQYSVIQNDFAFDFFNEVVESGEAIIESVGCLGQYGEKTFILAKLPEKYLLGGVDEHKSYVLLTNDHSGNGNCLILPTDVRVVCNNTLQWALGASKKDGVMVAKIRHSGDVKMKVKMAVDTLNLARKSHELMQKFNEKLITIPLIGNERKSYIYDLLDVKVESKKDMEEINSAMKLNQAEIIESLCKHGTGAEYFPDTAYNYLNAVTEWVDHKKSVRGGDNLSSLFYRGNGFELKQKAERQLHQLVDSYVSN